MLLRAVLGWLGLMALAILNGAFREAILASWLGPQMAHVASTIILCALILLTAWLIVPWMAPREGRGALLIGGAWLMLTLLFEFSFGYFVAGLSVAQLLTEYDFTAGRIWPLVPLVVFASPYVAGRLRGLL